MVKRSKIQHKAAKPAVSRAGDKSPKPKLGAASAVGAALFPKIKRKVLALFLLNPDNRYYFREAARLIGDTPGSVQRELKTLTEVGILLMEPIGIQKFYRANKDHPVFPELKALAEKTFGLADILKDLLRKHTDKIDLSFVFGSVAKGQETGKSDIDLLVVGSISLREITGILEPLEQKTRRAINPVLFSRAEFLSKAKKGDHFVRTMLDSEKIFIIGDADELERMVEN